MIVFFYERMGGISAVFDIEESSVRNIRSYVLFKKAIYNHMDKLHLEPCFSNYIAKSVINLNIHLSIRNFYIDGILLLKNVRNKGKLFLLSGRSCTIGNLSIKIKEPS